MDAQRPAIYRIRVRGRLDSDWSEWFDNLAVTSDESGETTRCGLVPEQAALHGLLARVRDLGLPLVSVSRVEPDSGA